MLFDMLVKTACTPSRWKFRITSAQAKRIAKFHFRYPKNPRQCSSFLSLFVLCEWLCAFSIDSALQYYGLIISPVEVSWQCPLNFIIHFSRVLQTTDTMVYRDLRKGKPKSTTLSKTGYDTYTAATSSWLISHTYSAIYVENITAYSTPPTNSNLHNCWFPEVWVLALQKPSTAAYPTRLPSGHSHLLSDSQSTMQKFPQGMR